MSAKSMSFKEAAREILKQARWPWGSLELVVADNPVIGTMKGTA